jgi:hypothetical protein
MQGVLEGVCTEGVANSVRSKGSQGMLLLHTTGALEPHLGQATAS